MTRRLPFFQFWIFSWYPSIRSPPPPPRVLSTHKRSLPKMMESILIWAGIGAPFATLILKANFESHVHTCGCTHTKGRYSWRWGPLQERELEHTTGKRQSLLRLLNIIIRSHLLFFRSLVVFSDPIGLRPNLEFENHHHEWRWDGWMDEWVDGCE